MPKLLITRKLPETVMEAARARFDTEVRAETKPLTVTEARAALWIYDAIIPTLGDAFSAAAFEETPRTKILANFGVGYNHIDAAAARAVGVEVTNTPGAVTDATADIAMTLILMTCRRAGEGERIVRAGKWAGLAADRVPRHARHRQDAGRDRHGPDRQGHRPARAGRLRHEGRVPQPLPRGGPGRGGHATRLRGRGDGRGGCRRAGRAGRGGDEAPDRGGGARRR
jgi:hypothetical protein